MNANGTGQHERSGALIPSGPSMAMQRMPSGETSAITMAEKAKALVMARYMMALQRPRDLDVVRQKMLAECRDPLFANDKSTYYIKPIGQGVRGLGIRFAEMAMRTMRNISVDVDTSYDDDIKRILAVSVTDLEENVPLGAAVTVSKTVERRSVPEGQSYLSKRLNSENKWTYTVPATDDDLLSKQGALVSKAMREMVLRLVPGALKRECEALILKTRKETDAKDPQATRKALADSFVELGVSVQQLIEYLGHPLDQITPDELEVLRGVYGAIADDETTWRAVVENKREQGAVLKPEAGDNQSGGDAGASGKAGEGGTSKLPGLNEAEFNAGFESWEATIKKGKKSAADVIAMIETAHTLTADQRAKLEAVVATPKK